jgi:hypothetical protein
VKHEALSRDRSGALDHEKPTAHPSLTKFLSETRKSWYLWHCINTRSEELATGAYSALPFWRARASMITNA